MKRFGLILVTAILAVGLLFVGCDDNKKPSKVTITFDADGGTFVDGGAATKDVKINKGAVVDIPAASEVTRADYGFEGWYTEEDGGGDKLTAETKHDANTTYFANWKKDQVTITFDADGGTFTSAGTPATKTVAIDKGAVVAIPADTEVTRDGFTFDGWFTAKNGDGTKLVATTTHSANTTYFANWEEDSPGELVFSLAEWIETATVSAQFSGSASSANPFYRSSSCIAAAVEEDADGVKHIYVQYGTTSATVPGTTHGLSLAINSDGQGLELDLVNNIYFVKYEGIYHGSQNNPVPTSSDKLLVRPGNSGVTPALTFTTVDLVEEADAPFSFTFTAEEPESNAAGWNDVFRLQLSPGVTVGNTPADDSVYVSVYNIEIYLVGPRD